MDLKFLRKSELKIIILIYRYNGFQNNLKTEGREKLVLMPKFIYFETKNTLDFWLFAFITFGSIVQKIRKNQVISKAIALFQQITWNLVNIFILINCMYLYTYSFSTFQFKMYANKQILIQQNSQRGFRFYSFRFRFQF